MSHLAVRGATARISTREGTASELTWKIRTSQKRSSAVVPYGWTKDDITK
jgi:hypothetical protein